MGVQDFFLGNAVYAFFQFPLGEVYNRFGIDIDVAVTDFKVQVRSRRFSRVSGKPDNIAGVDVVAYLEQ